MIIVRMILRRFSFKHYIKEIKFSFTKVLVEYNRATAPHSLLLKFNLFLFISPLFFSFNGFNLKMNFAIGLSSILQILMLIYFTNI